MELEERITNEELPTEMLPEPLMVMLSPPPQFLPVPGEPAIPWERWWKYFEQYLEGLGATNLADSSKCALLQHCLGLEGQRIYMTLMGGETSFAAAISTLAIHFGSNVTPQMYRFRFRQRAQRPGETVEQFVSALQELVKPCNYGDLEEEIVIDQMIEKTTCMQFRERLLLEHDSLTLADAVVTGKQVEYDLKENEPSHVEGVLGQPEVSVYMDNEDHQVVQKRKRGRPRRSEALKREKSEDDEKDGKQTNNCDDDGKGFDYANASEDSDVEDADFDEDEIEDEAYGDANDEDYIPGADLPNNGVSSGHRARKVASSGSKSQGHFCPICVNRSFRGANKLARHMRKHTKEKPFSCPVCAKTFSQSYHMNRHLRIQHGPGHYICPDCGVSVESWAEMRTHKANHTLEKVGLDSGKKTSPAPAKPRKRIRRSDPLRLICDVCGKIFARLYRLKRHKATHEKTGERERHQCPDCDKSYACPHYLKKHQETHEKEKSGTCLKCDQIFTSPEELEQHMETHKQAYPCTVCGKKFKFEFALKKHELIHKEQKRYCSVCNKHFINRYLFDRHMNFHKRRQTLKCPHCVSVFLHLKTLKKHLRTHVDERPHQCACCEESFTEKEELELHCLTHKEYRKDRPYSCSRCSYAFSSLEELTAHMVSHKGEPAMKCPECNMTFLNKSKLEKHMALHTGERPQLCCICSRGFPSSTRLKLHMRIHTGERPFRCTHCSRTFINSSCLKKHSRLHMAVRPRYPCPDCDRTYGRMTELKMHQRSHTGDKPFVCSCCDKRFEREHKLSVHMRIHTGERPYSCSECGQTFTQSGDRNRHMSKYHS